MGFREEVRDWYFRLATDTDGKSLSVQQVAERTGLSRPTLYRIVNADGDTSPGTLETLARAFGAPVPGLRLVESSGPQHTPETLIAQAIAALQGAQAILAATTPEPELDLADAIEAAEIHNQLADREAGTRAPGRVKRRGAG